ncbi:putative sporulation protein YtaF [Keratinibaculum paraultunense]|uniref:Putative sporulation protein YtaF n=1 Tax=Keratinibaculum paraultunense TaxID=1278232 RepID=A0A4V2UTN9_9FIRM|nr:sporulation membrane protein YtaF [Keratinibaculum paraultunense]QQY79749.1 sporulation membrane protein YtaF [Keratinibaculum paraultunense]TCS86942.1 putative sporulation protein YtaF [Keratinibaculum paraultunense]
METILLVLTLSIDAFVASLAYGTNRIKIPMKSIIFIDIICAIFLALSMLLAISFKKILPVNVTSIISFILLIILGIYYLFESIIKKYLNEKSSKKRQVKLKLFNLWLIIDIYIDETKADLDNSKTISLNEALYLAAALSIDSIAIGFGTGIGNINYFAVIVLSLIWDIIAIWSGLFLGRKFTEKININLSWLSGILLILLAFLKLK